MLLWQQVREVRVDLQPRNPQGEEQREQCDERQYFPRIPEYPEFQQVQEMREAMQSGHDQFPRLLLATEATGMSS